MLLCLHLEVQQYLSNMQCGRDSWFPDLTNLQPIMLKSLRFRRQFALHDSKKTIAIVVLAMFLK